MAVLVIEDDFETRETLVDVLLARGIEAHSAKDGRDGMLELRMRPDVGLVLLDLEMPMMDARAFRAAQLAEPAFASIPVGVLSGSDGLEAKAAELGAAFALAKPCQASALVEAVTSAEVVRGPHERSGRVDGL